MSKQAGISTVGVALITAVVVGGGAGAFAWMQQQKLEQVRGELGETKVQLDAANKSANAARAQAAAARKELDELKLSMDQLRAERDSAKALLEAEKQYSERARAELAVAREQIVMLSRRPAYATPQVMQPQILRIAPAPHSGSAISRSQAAPAPASR